MTGRWLLASAFGAYGIAAVGNWASPKWILVTLACYSLPLLGQIVRSRSIQAYTLWFGAFLVLQSLLTPLVIDRNLVTLQPNLERRLDVVGDGLPGIQGPQTITTDSMGFRVTRTVSYDAKPEGTYRIFAIGGSTTEQILLDDYKTWTHLLQERVGARFDSLNVEVINTGVSGLRSEQHLSTLKFITQFSPDLVVFLIGINDWNRHIWDVHGDPEHRSPRPHAFSFSESLLGAALKGIQGVLEPLPEPAVEFETGEYYSTQNDSLRRNQVRRFRPDAVSDSYHRALEQIRDACHRASITCMFVNQPTGYLPDAPADLRRHFWMTPPNTSYTLDFESLVRLSNLYNQYLLSFANENSLASCDLVAHFEPSLEDFYDDCHFNTAGAQRVAVYLEQCVAELLEN